MDSNFVQSDPGLLYYINGTGDDRDQDISNKTFNENETF